MTQLKTTKKAVPPKQAAKPSKVEVATELTDEQLDTVSGGVEQVLNIGSQSSGAGAGKVTFNPF